MRSDKKGKLPYFIVLQVKLPALLLMCKKLSSNHSELPAAENNFQTLVDSQLAFRVGWGSSLVKKDNVHTFSQAHFYH